MGPVSAHPPVRRGAVRCRHARVSTLLCRAVRVLPNLMEDGLLTGYAPGTHGVPTGYPRCGQEPSRRTVCRITVQALDPNAPRKPRTHTHSCVHTRIYMHFTPHTTRTLPPPPLIHTHTRTARAAALRPVGPATGAMPPQVPLHRVLTGYPRCAPGVLTGTHGCVRGVRARARSLGSTRAAADRGLVLCAQVQQHRGIAGSACTRRCKLGLARLAQRCRSNGSCCRSCCRRSSRA
jgi:hypothetical protein